MTDYYRLGQPALAPKKQRRRRRWLWRLLWLLLLLLIVWFSYRFVRTELTPETTIKQAKPVTVNAAYADTKVEHYDMPNFGIDVVATMQLQPRPAGQYISFTWLSSKSGSDGRKIEVFEDIIPVNYAVNRALVVTAENDRLQIEGAPSDNCVTFTRDLSGIPNSVAAPAKWNNISFLCDRANQARNSIGTSSTDGVNTVILKTSLGVPHKYFFVYTDQSINPDPSAFLQALQSFRMK